MFPMAAPVRVAAARPYADQRFLAGEAQAVNASSTTPPPASSPPDTQPAVLRVVVDHLSAMVAYWDAKQRCCFANRAYQSWFGVDPESIVGRNMREVLGPLYALNLPYIEGVLRGEPQEFERDIPDPRGGPTRHSLAQYFPDIVAGQVRGFCVLVTDITRLKQAERALLDVERRLQASERLAALASLAAGIAHEINNPLAAVMAHTEVALEVLSEPNPDLGSLATDLEAAREGARRVRAVVHSMRVLTKGDAQHEPVDMDDTLEQSLTVVAFSLRDRARVVRELESRAFVQGNASQLGQVFVNLLTNAAQSMPSEGHAGEIRVSTRREGERVIVEISDNGCGIPPELQAHLFEPLVAPRPAGVGIGIGLSLSSAIVSAFGGTLSVTSEVGRGSVFRVTLPAVADAPPLPARASRPPPTASPRSGPARVLIVDDELAVTKTLERILSRDCEVVVANRGRDAISLLLRPGPPTFDLVLCDMMMPELDGEAVYSEVMAARPELAARFVFMTGGATPQARAFLEKASALVLDKPFDLKLLRALVAARTATAGAV